MDKAPLATALATGMWVPIVWFPMAFVTSIVPNADISRTEDIWIDRKEGANESNEDKVA